MSKANRQPDNALLVELARPCDSLLHRFFEWDDDAAAAKAALNEEGSPLHPSTDGLRMASPRDAE
jgi:hypothetical protein